MLKRTLSLAFILATLIAVFVLPVSALTYTVTNCAGSADIGGSLFWAIDQANANAGPDIVAFNLSSEVGYGPLPGGYTTEAGVSWWRINLATELSAITGEVVINGSTQQNTNPYGPDVEISGRDGRVDRAFLINAANCTIKGLCLNSFRLSAIEIAGSGTVDCDNCVIAGNYIGTDPTGTAARPNGNHGIFLWLGPDSTLIGGTAEAERNLISGNSSNGIYIDSSDGELLARYTRIIGNYIGVNRTGSAALPNGGRGIHFNRSVRSSTIGGPNAGEGNLISGNTQEGISIGSSDNNNQIIGNFIGVNAGATAAVPNRYGLLIQSSGNTVNQNVISGNSLAGLIFYTNGASGNRASGNYIGTDASGTVALPNTWAGAGAFGGSYQNVFGPGNIIAFNTIGLGLSGETTVDNRITQNSFFQNNGAAISLIDKANRRARPPVITGAAFNADQSALVVTGTASPQAIVEVFRSDGISDATLTAEGKTYLGSTTAEGTGAWSATLVGATGGGSLCATAGEPYESGGLFSVRAKAVADYLYNTSQFSRSYPAPTTTTTTTTTGTSTTTTTGTTTTTSTLPIPEGKAFSVIRLSSSGALVNLAFTSRISGPVKCFVEDIGVSPAGNLGTLDLQVSEGNNFLSLPAAKGWEGKLIRMTFVYGGVSYRVKGFVPAMP
jgi:hypothetical protein